MSKKGLVISGGGSRGAWGAGIAKGLYEFQGKDYDVFVGSSTGSLMSPLIASKEFDKLEEAYTNINNNSIYTINPFKRNGNVKYLLALWRVITRKLSIGDSSNLKNLIKEFVTEDSFKKIKESNKEVITTVVNLNKGDVEYYSSKDTVYEDFIDWMNASASAPIIMNITTKNGYQYVDGGVIDAVPIYHAIKNGCTEIDVIIHKKKGFDKEEHPKQRNLLQLCIRLVRMFVTNITKDDVQLADVADEASEDVTINYYYMPQNFVSNLLTFDSTLMKRMFKIGYLSMNRADKISEIKRTVIINSNKKIKRGNDNRLQK